MVKYLIIGAVILGLGSAAGYLAIELGEAKQQVAQSKADLEAEKEKHEQTNATLADKQREASRLQRNVSNLRGRLNESTDECLNTKFDESDINRVRSFREQHPPIDPRGLIDSD